MWADLELIVLGAGAGFCCGLAWVKSQKARAARRTKAAAASSRRGLEDEIAQLRRESRAEHEAMAAAAARLFQKAERWETQVSKDVNDPELFDGCRSAAPSVEASLEEILRILRRMDAQGIPVTDSMPGFAVGSLRGGDFLADQASLVARAEAMVRDGALPENWRELYGEPVAGNVIGQPRGLRFEGHFASWPSPPAARPATGSASQETCRSAPDSRSAS